MTRRHSRRTSDRNVPVIDLVSASAPEDLSRPPTDKNNEGDESSKNTGSSSSWMDEEPLDQLAASLRRARRHLRTPPARTGLPRVRRRRRPPRRVPRYDFDADEEPESGDSSASLESPRPRPRVEEVADEEEQYTPTRRRNITLMPHPPIPRPSDHFSTDSPEDDIMPRSRSAAVNPTVINLEQAGHTAQYVSSDDSEDDRSSTSSVVPIRSTTQQQESADEPELMDLVSTEGSPQRIEELRAEDEIMHATAPSAKSRTLREQQSAHQQFPTPSTAIATPMHSIHPLPSRQPLSNQFTQHATRPSSSSATPQSPSPSPTRAESAGYFTMRHNANPAGSPALQRMAPEPTNPLQADSNDVQLFLSPKPRLRSAPASPATPTRLGLHTTLPEQVEKLALGGTPVASVSSPKVRAAQVRKSSTPMGSARTGNSNPIMASGNAQPKTNSMLRSFSSMQEQATTASVGTPDRLIRQSSVQAALQDFNDWNSALWSEAQAAYRHFAGRLGEDATFQCASLTNNTLLKAMRQVGQLLGARPITVPNKEQSRFVELTRSRNSTIFPESEEDFRGEFDGMLTKFFIAEHSKDSLADQMDVRNRVYVHEPSTQAPITAAGNVQQRPAKPNSSTPRQQFESNKTSTKPQRPENRQSRFAHAEQGKDVTTAAAGSTSPYDKAIRGDSSNQHPKGLSPSTVDKRQAERFQVPGQSSTRNSQSRNRAPTDFRLQSYLNQNLSEPRDRQSIEYPKRPQEHSGGQSKEYSDRRARDNSDRRYQGYSERRSQEHRSSERNGYYGRLAEREGRRSLGLQEGEKMRETFREQPQEDESRRLRWRGEESRRPRSQGEESRRTRSQREENRRGRSYGRRGYRRQDPSSRNWDKDTSMNPYATRSEERSFTDTPRVARPPDRVGGRIEKRKRNRGTRDLGEAWDMEVRDREAQDREARDRDARNRDYSPEASRFRRNSRDDRYHRRKRRNEQQRGHAEDGSGWFYNDRKRRERRRF